MPNIDGNVDPSLYITPTSLKCMLCEKAQETTTLILYNLYSTQWHMSCLIPPLDQILIKIDLLI